MAKSRGSTQRTRAHSALLDILIEVRGKAGLSQRALAERLKLPRSYVSKIEKAERRVDPVECVTWALACDVQPLAFFRLFVKRLPQQPYGADSRRSNRNRKTMRKKAHSSSLSGKTLRSSSYEEGVKR